MKRRKGLLLAAMAVLVPCAGCGVSTVAKLGFKEMRGAAGDVTPIVDLPAYELLQYGSVKAEQISTDIGPLVPADFLSLLRGALQERLATLYGLKAGGPPLLLTGRVTYYQAGKGVSTLLGKDKTAIMHAWVTTPGGEAKGEFLVVATSEAMRTGESELAEAMAKGVLKYFARKLPEPPER